MADRTRTHKGINYVVSAAHPAADAFPWLDESDLQALADDIGTNGQNYRIVRLPDERVVDGRNRELACRIAGVVPQYTTEIMTDDEVVTLVISRNVHRRNLTVSQRSMAAAELANMRRGDNQHGRVGTSADPLQKYQENKVSEEEAAQKLDVSPRSVRSAKKVKDKAPELVDAVKSGDLDVKTAEKVAKLPKRSRKKVAESSDKKAAAKEEIAKSKADPAAIDPAVAFVSEIDAVCKALDAAKKKVVELIAVPLLGLHLHGDSVTHAIQAARQALWQSRPTEPCNCVCGGKSPINPQCRLCFGSGLTSAGRAARVKK